MKRIFPWCKNLTIALTLFSGLSVLSIPQKNVVAAPHQTVSPQQTGTSNKIEVGTPSRTDPPENTSKPGGTLDPSDPCQIDGIQLTALVPPDNDFSQLPELADVPVLTVSAQPALLFYMPYEASSVRYGEFSIAEWPDEQASPPYEMMFTLPQTPGIVSVTPDPSSRFSLEVEKDYRWRLRLYCGPGNTASDYILVRGIIRRIESSPETEALLSTFSPDIWYDAIAQLANQLQADAPNVDESLTARWFELVGLVDLEENELEALIPDILVGPVIRIDE